MPAQSYLRRAENAATSHSGPSFSATKGLYTGTGRSKSTRKSQVSRGLPAILIVTIMVAAFGFFTAVLNLPLPDALENLFTTKTDTANSAIFRRAPRLTARMLGGSNNTTSTSWTGLQKYNSIPDYFRQRLGKSDIEVNGSSLTYQGQTITSDDLLSTYDSNTSFRDAYTDAKFGRAANFYDTGANSYYYDIGVSRNEFRDYRQTGDTEADARAYEEIMSSQFDGNDTDISARRQGEVPTVDDNGNPTTEYISETDTSRATSESGTTITDAETRANSYISGIASKAANVTNWGCTLFQVGSLISTAIAANELYQTINYFMGYMENISKMKAGYGAESGVNEVLNFLNTSTTTTVEDFTKASYSGGINGNQIDLSVELSETTTTGTPLESNGMQFIMTDATPDQSETANYSLERAGLTLGAALGTIGVTHQTCSVARGAAALASLAVSIIPGVGQVSVIGGFIINMVVGVGFTLALSTFLGFLIPTIAQSLFTNFFETASGIPAGEAFTKGAFAANSGNARSASGQSPSSAEAVLAYNQTQNTVLAQEAEQDRLNRSPFDTTSPNTFLGSLTHNLTTILSSSHTNSLSTLLRTTTSSLANLTSNVSAEGENSSYITTFGNCPELEAIGAVGDIYCNPITTTDTSTIDLSPDDPTYVNTISTQLDCDTEGNCTIKDDSELGKYVSYCANRKSPFGITDANILNELELGGIVTSTLPIIGDVFDLLNAGASPENLAWATGANCVNSSENSRWDSEMKYYQRYIEDQRILEQMGAYEDGQNPVTAYKSAYDTAHPADNSSAGYLARISGMTKSDAETILAIAEYETFLANYDASERAHLDGTTSNIPTSSELIAQFQTHSTSHSSTPSLTSLLAHTPVYDTIRNRNYAA